MVRLVRSKGVGIYFVTQNPADIPDTVLAQLGNRIQHALRAYTPAEQKGLKAAADSFRPNPAFDTADHHPGPGRRRGAGLGARRDAAPRPWSPSTLIRPPDSRVGPALPGERAAVMGQSPVAGVYDTAINREVRL